MKIRQLSFKWYAISLCFWSWLIDSDAFAYRYTSMKKSRCLNPPRTARRVENVIKDCQDDVKNKLLIEAYELLKLENSHEYAFIEENSDHRQQLNDSSPSAPHSHNKYEYFLPPEDEDTHYDDTERKRRTSRLLHRIRRVGDMSYGIYHPTLVPHEDKRIAGCLLHCVYAKNNAIDNYGWPTLDGLVDFYSEGVNEHGFFMATLRSVNLCLRAATSKYHVNRRKLPEQGESCDLAFDVFDCISDQITGYCLDEFKH